MCSVKRYLLCAAAIAGAAVCVGVMPGAFADEAAGAGAARWDTQSDTWVATDALGRSLPTSEEVGSPRANKFVGIFYFLWLGRHGDAGPFDISKILAADPTAISNPRSPLWGALGVPHHWGESIFGYYRGDDEGVLAKHAQMLADAQVDVVIFDVTNQLTYPESWRALGRVFDRVRGQGGKTPQIAFLCPFWQPAKVVRELFDDLYGPGLHADLWFRWEGKPLILADPRLLGRSDGMEKQDTPVELRPGHRLGQSLRVGRPFDAVGGCFPTWASTTSGMVLSLYRDGPKGERLARQRFDRVQDNAWLWLEFPETLAPGDYYLEMSDPAGKVGWWSTAGDAFSAGQAYDDDTAVGGDRTIRIHRMDEKDARIRRFFTFRKPQPDYFVGPTGGQQWGWLEVYPQHAFYKTPGTAEQVAVGVAQNAVDGRLGVLSNPRSHGRSFHDGRQPGPEGQDDTGRNFAEQWRRAFELDPQFVFITGWNEWIAGRFDIHAPFHGAGPVTFVDQFNQQYSRDIEPMKGGHGDNYYYQMVANIRRFKGARALMPVVARPIRIDGRFDDWQQVAPEYRDQVGDAVRRDHAGWGSAGRYTNNTGRNDLVAAKLSWDDRYLYFHVRAREAISPAGGDHWMLLYLDTDQCSTNGWLGYDFVVNHAKGGPQQAVLERHQGQGYQWGSPVHVEYRVEGTQLEMAIPRSMLGLEKLPASIDFKWADHIQETGEWSDFTLHGDAAPNDRFNYRARLQAVAGSQAQ